jgi:hypothetical protein
MWTEQSLSAQQIPGNSYAKIIFQVGQDKPERMWVILDQLENPEQWRGKIDNEATQANTAKVLPAGKLVLFHPLDVVALYNNSMTQRD